MAFMRRLEFTTDTPATSGHWANENGGAMENFGNYTPDTAEIIAPVQFTFTTPPSGLVWVLLSCDLHNNTAGNVEHGYFGLHESGSLLPGSRKRMMSAGPNHKRRAQYDYIGNVIPGLSKTWVWVWEGGGADDVRANAADDGFTRPYMEIWELK